MKKIALVLSIFLVSSCGETPSYLEGNTGSSGLEYFKDSRTELCFAERGSGNSYTMTCVPCSEEIEKLIKSYKSYE